MEIQHPLKKQATWTFTVHMMVFIIAILVNSKQLKENEKLSFLWIFKDKILVLKI